MRAPWRAQSAWVLALVLATPFAVFARADTQPIDLIRQSTTRIAGVLRPGHKPTPVEQEEVLRLIQETTDFETIAQNVFGSRWEMEPEELRREFLATFSRLVGISAIQKMGVYRADRLEYLGQEVDGDRALVRTIVTYGNKRVPLDYMMTRADGQWQITDYRLNGVLSSANYRKQFDRVLKKESFAQLVARLKKRLPVSRVPTGRS